MVNYKVLGKKSVSLSQIPVRNYYIRFYKIAHTVPLMVGIFPGTAASSEWRRTGWTRRPTGTTSSPRWTSTTPRRTTRNVNQSNQFFGSSKIVKINLTEIRKIAEDIGSSYDIGR